MKDVFRIISTTTHDVLLKKSWDKEDEYPAIAFLFFPIEGIETSFELTFDTEEIRDLVFNEYTEEQTNKMVSNVINDILK